MHELAAQEDDTVSEVTFEASHMTHRKGGSTAWRQGLMFAEIGVLLFLVAVPAVCVAHGLLSSRNKTASTILFS